MTDSLAARLSSLPVPQILGGLAAAALLVAGASFLLSERQFKAATEQHPWLRHASEQRTLADRFRFALTDPEDVATALAPAAVAGVEALPLSFAAEATVADATGLIASLNDINPACERIAVAPASCGEAAVSRRQVRLEQALDLIPLKADYWIERNGVQLAFSKLILMSARVCGLTPYRTETALLVKAVDGHDLSGITGWKALAPGECTEVTFGKYRHAPEVFAHSRAADDDAIAMLRADARYAATWGNNEVAWGGSGPEAVSACVASQDTGLMAEQCDALDSPVLFRAVQTEVSDAVGTSTWLLADPGLCRPDCAWNQPSNQPLVATLQAHAVQLGSLLAQRKAYRQRYGDARPYINGVTAVDDNGPYRAGIRVTEVEAFTPFGVASPFKVGDVITSLAGVPVFSLEDLDLALALFATQFGADKPYSYEFWRHNPANGQMEKAELNATVYFDTEYWLANGYSDSQARAMMEGFLNAASFGLYRVGWCSLKWLFGYETSVEACRIRAVNAWMIIRQLYPDAYSWGGLPAMLFSPIRLILGVAGITVSATAGLVIELLEAGLSTAANGAPGQSVEISARDFTQSIIVGRLTQFGTAIIRPGAFS